ncbi:unnamed protein product [Coregonus sp. 'balchen']|nr:unnamed protein product [Coregonus sp. 'balchen']
MLWEVNKTEGVEENKMDANRMEHSFDLLKCNEALFSSPGCPPTPMEYDDLPELQEVEENQSSPVLFRVGAGVSHRECIAGSPHTNWLTELANIATSPQSPLLQEPAPIKRSSPVHIFATSRSLHSYARPPLASSAPSPSRGHLRERSRRASSESESGTRLRFHGGSNKEWQEAEDLEDSDDESDDDRIMPSTSRKSYGSEGLKLVAHEENVSYSQAVLKLTFDPGSPEDGLLTAECRFHHPFFVKNKGWSSFYPSLTVVQHGIPCYEMQVGDLCLPPGHRDAINCDDSVVFDTFRSYDFTPLDSSAVYVLSSMARQRRTSQSSGGAVSPDPEKLSSSSHPSSASKSNRSNTSGTAPGGATPTKCKRPMNAFMLFAKKYRLEYTQMYPGKDNRAISVILGDKWKKMKSEERRMYTGSQHQ